MTILNYVIITPLRNEILTLETTLRSVINQSRTPKYWFILDDGSSDGSPEVVMNYCNKYPWIKLERLSDRGMIL